MTGEKSSPLTDREELAECAEAVAWLATHRTITPVHVSKVKTDRQIRKVLSNIVRLRSKTAPVLYFSSESRAGNEKIDKDHIVPVRALVDRMIMNPDDCKTILDSIVLAEITKSEHKRLGGLWSDHKDAYARMLTSPVDHLVTIGLERYANVGLVLQSIGSRMRTGES